MKIVEIIPKDNYLPYIKADDGTTGIFDVRPYLDSEAFEPLKDQQQFERVRNGKYFVEWDCGADLSDDTIQARWTIQSGMAQPYAPADATKSDAQLR